MCRRPRGLSPLRWDMLPAVICSCGHIERTLCLNDESWIIRGIYVYSNIAPHNRPPRHTEHVITPISQWRRLRLRKTNWLSQGDKANKRLDHSRKGRLPAPGLGLFSQHPNAPQSMGPRGESEQELWAGRTTPGGQRASKNAKLNRDWIVYVHPSSQTRICLRVLTKAGHKSSKSHSEKLWVFTQGLKEYHLLMLSDYSQKLPYIEFIWFQIGIFLL